MKKETKTKLLNTLKEKVNVDFSDPATKHLPEPDEQELILLEKMINSSELMENSDGILSIILPQPVFFRINNVLDHVISLGIYNGRLGLYGTFINIWFSTLEPNIKTKIFNDITTTI